MIVLKSKTNFSYDLVSNSDHLGSHLKQLLGEAEMRLQELGGLLEEPSLGAPLNTRASFSSIMGNAYPASTMTGALFHQFPTYHVC